MALIFAFLLMLICGTGGGFIAGLALGLWINDDLTRVDRAVTNRR